MTPAMAIEIIALILLVTACAHTIIKPPLTWKRLGTPHPADEGWTLQSGVATHLNGVSVIADVVTIRGVVVGTVKGYSKDIALDSQLTPLELPGRPELPEGICVSGIVTELKVQVYGPGKGRITITGDGVYGWFPVPDLTGWSMGQVVELTITTKDKK